MTMLEYSSRQWEIGVDVIVDGVLEEISALVPPVMAARRFVGQPPKCGETAENGTTDCPPDGTECTARIASGVQGYPLGVLFCLAMEMGDKMRWVGKRDGWKTSGPTGMRRVTNMFRLASHS